MAAYFDMAEVRELLCATPAVPVVGEGAAPSTEILSRLFHEVLDGFAGSAGHEGSIAVLAEESLDPARWEARLVEDAYLHSIGPALKRFQAELHPLSFHVCQLWVAVRNLCAWIAARMWRAYQASGRLPEPGSFAKIPVPAQLELYEPGWSDVVFVTHVREGLFRVPGYRERVAFALRLAPERDGDGLGHASFYRLLMYGGRGTEALGDLVLVSFGPGCDERVFDAAALDLGQRQLLCLIGQAAGVVSSMPLVVPDAQGRGLAQDYSHIGRVLIEILHEHGVEVRMASPPLPAKGRVQFAVALPAGVRVTQRAELAEAIKSRLRLRARPLVEHFAGQLLVGIELKARPIVFFWPTGWAGYRD